MTILTNKEGIDEQEEENTNSVNIFDKTQN